ncbi:diguanylate cyclase [Sphingomonas sp. A2-49]|uniref:ligand-binding sensor domain-containing diguanylate cyclase n=1 Tax=Sphingomonas sp. A2-49 TaxID=1391375 RepID=UPI0021D1D35E|nr:ligand-binding sensor domain-containing diguanylate cyclase [Sphingomonas sp. A2-49]MCU6456106.1 diguanylate cyclase [Sphingomonas sp. A2-49]
MACLAGSGWALALAPAGPVRSRTPHAAAPAADPWRSAADLFFKVAARDDAIPDAGLPRAVAQDRAGFIWLATDAGLARWDGTGFKTYTTDPAPAAGALPELLVNLLFADRAGTLWLGMSAEGLLWHDPASERFRRPPNRTALDHAHVQSVADDGAGGLWVGSDTGLAHVRAGDRRVALVAPDARNGVPPGAIQAVLADPAGSVWIAAGARLLRRPAGSATFHPAGLGVTPPAIGAIAALHADAAGRLWIATTRAGLFAVGVDGTVAHPPIGTPGNIPALGTIIDAGDGTLWVASRAGIWSIDPATFRVRRLAHDPLSPGSLAEDGLNHLMRDRSGMVWIVGDASLSYVDPAPGRVLGLVGALRPDRGASPDAAWSVGTAPDGAIWYGTADTPASRLAPAGHGVAPAQRLPGARRGVHAFAFPPGRGAFVAAEDGLFHLSVAGGDARRLTPVPAMRLLVDGDTLYVGGGSGVATLDVRHPAAPVAAPWSRALTDPRVRALAVTGDGSLWIGTARGLNRIDRATGTVTQLRPRSGAATALRANFVSTLLADAQGRLWAGTLGGGITVFERGRDGWRATRHLGRREGVPHDTIDKLLPGDDGAIWASTDGGIVRIDPVRWTVTALRAADGVAFAANWTGAGDRLADGRLVFAGFGGLTIIDPLLPPAVANRAPLRFTALRSGGAAVVAAPGTAHVAIGSTDRSLTAEFARLDYAASHDQAYAYRLFPLEREWTRVDAMHRVARYTNLAPGRATLVVRAIAPVAGGGVRTIGAPLVLRIDVARRWFETLAFRIGVMLASVAAVLALVHLRMRGARRRERLLERLVERRTAELMVSRSELEKLAYSDTLTGLGNRRLYGEVVGRHLCDAAARPFALLLLDLDRFKQVNDELGHDVGDALLVEVADRLTATTRQFDSIFRLGGDEFAVLVAGVADAHAVEEVCRRLYAVFAAPVAIGEHALPVALSIGAVIADRADRSIEALYKHADLALYDAKRAGRGTWRLAPAGPG